MDEAQHQQAAAEETDTIAMLTDAVKQCSNRRQRDSY